ncbi:MAG: hypothetical protein ACRBB0_05075 [Pelagimonas sp.]|uniref:hypothetical protein n=1 Tax=Pelagimonas sp. TaxID=2073170 RepID=UPI003D6B5271
MSDWPEVQTCYVLPSGVATLPFEGGAITCRVTLGHINAPDTGLLEEMQSKAEPVPWRDTQTRDEAIVAIEARNDLGEDMRAKLLNHIRQTPWYE